MEPEKPYILYLDDYHTGDVHFLQSLARGLARMNARPAPVVVHGSGEHAERALEANGIFRRREYGVLPIESRTEYILVDRAARQLNQKIVAMLNDAVVPSVGIMGTQRRSLIVRDGRISAAGGWIHSLMRQGIVPVVAAFASLEEGGASGEVPIFDAVSALAASFAHDDVQVVFFTKTKLPGLMQGGRPLERVGADHEMLANAVPDREGMRRLLNYGYSILLTNTTRLADEGGPVGTNIRSDDDSRANLTDAEMPG